MKNKIIIITLIFMGTLSSLCFAEKIALWEQKINAQVEYQKNIANLLLRKAPNLEEVIIINRDLQTTMYEMKREKYLHLIIHHPGRIDPDKDLNFEWTDEDEKKLLESNKNYEILKNKKEKLKIKNQGHPMWPALREAFAMIKETEEYKKIHYKLMEIINR